MKKIIYLLLPLFVCGCIHPPNTADTASKSARSMFGDGFHVLKFPVKEFYIGTEWVEKNGRPNETKGSGINELKAQKTANYASVDRNDLFFNLDLLYKFGPSADIKAEFNKSFESNGVTYIRASNIGDIPFKEGLWYVTEAVAVDSFLSNAKNSLEGGIRLKVADDRLAGAGIGGKTGGASGMSGNKLVVAYKVERIKSSTYIPPDKNDKYQQLSISQDSHYFPSTMFTASLKYIESESFNEDLIWSCVEARTDAADSKGKIHSAWIVKLKDEDGKVWPITFPAVPLGSNDLVKDNCKSYSAVIRSTEDSNTARIERIKAKIELKDSTFKPFTTKPEKVLFDVLLTKESFELESL